MLHGSSKGCFYCVWTDLWRYMGVHQREGVIGAIGALERLIPCVYGLYGVFRVNWWHCQCEREERLSGACFYWNYDGFSA